MSVEDTGTTAIHGWGCTPTGDPPAADVATAQNDKRRCLPTVFTRGWRRTILYAILVLLMVLIFLNITLTLWIVGALKLSMEGIGPIKIVNGGIQLRGQAWVVDKLVASKISSQTAQPITLHSHRNFTVQVAERDHRHRSRLLIKRDSIEFSGRALHVRDAHGASVFQAAKDEVRVFADALAVDGPGGLSVKSAIQAPSIRAPPAADLQLESLTRGLDLRAPKSIYLESRAGGIDITSQGDIKLNSIVGALRIETQTIVMNNLKEATTTDRPHRNVGSIKVYQLCACETGKLFLAAPELPCAASNDDTQQCR